jgi:hypothetical protein
MVRTARLAAHYVRVARGSPQPWDTPQDDQWECRWVYRNGRAEIRRRPDDGLADGFIDGTYVGKLPPDQAKVELERLAHDGWHAASVRFRDDAWRRTTSGVLARSTKVFRTAMIVELQGSWFIVDENMNRLEFRDGPLAKRSTFDNEQAAVIAAETLMARWSDAGRDPR